MSGEIPAGLLSRGPVCPGCSGMQNLMPVLPGICHAAMWAAAAFLPGEGGVR